jgi:hypothetical protein
MNNSEQHPEAWDFYEEQARNISDENSINHLGNYRIPNPDMSGKFVYATNVEILWQKFIREWYSIESLNAPTVRGKIQYITNNF